MKKLRGNIRILAVLVTVMFIALGVYFSYSVYYYGGRWFANVNNPRLHNQKQNVIAGDIIDRTGAVLATTRDGRRTYPPGGNTRKAVAHVVGDNSGMVANGAETFMATYLLGFKADVFDRVRQAFASGPERGDTGRLTISAELCAYAAELLSPYQAGAVVVLNYKTGEILCSTSYPHFDPKYMENYLNRKTDDGALVNRVTQGLYPPGSTFKIVTMASALENIEGVRNGTFECTGAVQIEQTIVTEASNQIHGKVSMEQAFAQSCNVSFSSLARNLGYVSLAKTASSFGFGDNFLFRDLVVFNSQYPTDKQSADDLAWSGIGQGRVLATPLHMAMIAGAVANDGLMMEPCLMMAAVSDSGIVRAALQSRVYKRALSLVDAKTIKDYMKACVRYGTGMRAAIDGYAVGGKTGSAEISDDKSVNTHAWFVGFVDDQRYPLAIAVLVEQGGAGSRVAAPIAQNVLRRAMQLGV